MRVPPGPRADPSLDAEELQRERFVRGFRAYCAPRPPPVVGIDDPNNLQISSKEDAAIAVLMILGPKDGE